MHPAFVSRSAAAIPLQLVTAKGLGPWTKAQPARIKVMVDAAGFRGDLGKALLVHGAGGELESVLVGLGEGADGFALASLPGSFLRETMLSPKFPTG